MKTNGKVVRGWLGIVIQEITKELSESFGMKNTNGALVAGIEKKSPAAKGGLLPGDVILKFNNIEIKKMPDLPRVVAESDVGSTAILEVWRKNKKINIEVILGELHGEVVKERKTT